ncbi:hypothetical protein IMAU30077_00624 [Lactobacillus helveticus]|nr:hypothetical protein [Lactobacillus helveticus]
MARAKYLEVAEKLKKRITDNRVTAKLDSQFLVDDPAD